jgi:hypothetical protein
LSSRSRNDQVNQPLDATLSRPAQMSIYLFIRPFNRIRHPWKSGASVRPSLSFCRAVSQLGPFPSGVGAPFSYKAAPSSTEFPHFPYAGNREPIPNSPKILKRELFWKSTVDRRDATHRVDHIYSHQTVVLVPASQGNAGAT